MTSAKNADSAKNPKKTKNFEAALARLEEIAAELEAGDLPLEKSIDRFAEGMELARLCNATLEEARGRIELLLGGDRNGPIESRPFFEDGEGEGRGTSPVSLRPSAPPPAEPEHGETKGGRRAPLFDDDDALPF